LVQKEPCRSDAALAAFESRLDDVEAGARAKAGEMLADLREKRDQFRQIVRTQMEPGEDSWDRAKAELEAGWRDYEARAKQYVETFLAEMEQQQAAFGRQADAQLKYWRAVADRLKSDAMTLTAEHRHKAEASARDMYADAAEAEKKLRQLCHASIQSWSAMMEGLAETRATFDRANQASVEAFRRAAN